MTVPADYLERVYAGVLGKIIGVYIGRPFEGWTYERITAELGDITYYVHEKLGKPLIVPDDDIGGTFTFLRALPDHEHARNLTPAQIGETWLNYIIKNQTILWWGGRGNSTEHTAFLNMLAGIMPPESGSIAVNGHIVAEQIGAQIFIDGWAMVAPGDPEFAADLARRAASVSHDGEAIYGAQVVAAMEAQAFVETSLDACIDIALRFIPKDSTIARLIGDVREWHAAEPDWRKAREKLALHYGYDKYHGVCHMVPNHGLIILSLLYGKDDFQQSMLIANTSGWDTDCNAGNVGCFLGIKNGLAGIDGGPDWRGPVADRLYLSTADGGRAISDAVTEAVHIVNIQRAMDDEPLLTFKGGARFHFELPGSTQGFRADESLESRGITSVENVKGHSREGERSLAIRFRQLAKGRFARVSTPTFLPEETLAMDNTPGSYQMVASPTLYPGQTVQASLSADPDNPDPVVARLFARIYGAEDKLKILRGPAAHLFPGADQVIVWRISGHPIAEIGIEVSSDKPTSGSVYLDKLTWDGIPNLTFANPHDGSTLWRRAWVPAIDRIEPYRRMAYSLVQNDGIGLLIQGSREWDNYTAHARCSTNLAKSFGIAVRVQGMRRYYALKLAEGNKAYLVKHMDGLKILAEANFSWEIDREYRFDLTVDGDRLKGSIDGRQLFDVQDTDLTLTGGGIAYVLEEGTLSSDAMTIAPLA